MVTDDDYQWLVQWARVLQRVKDGATDEHPTVLTPNECQVMARGIRALMKESCFEAE